MAKKPDGIDKVPAPANKSRSAQTAAKPSLKDLLLSSEARTETLTTPRGVVRRRSPTPLG